MELTFKDANGVELKPGDIVLRAIGSKFVERRIESITFSAATKMGADGVTPVPSFSTYVKTEGKGRVLRWRKNEVYMPDRYFDKGKLYTNDSNKVLKKG